MFLLFIAVPSALKNDFHPIKRRQSSSDQCGRLRERLHKEKNPFTADDCWDRNPHRTPRNLPILIFKAPDLMVMYSNMSPPPLHSNNDVTWRRKVLVSLYKDLCSYSVYVLLQAERLNHSYVFQTHFALLVIAHLTRNESISRDETKWLLSNCFMMEVPLSVTHTRLKRHIFLCLNLAVTGFLHPCLDGT